MNIPVIIEDKKYNFFIYVNNFDLQEQKNNQISDGLLMDSNAFGNFASFLPRDDFYKKKLKSNNSIMVVPFPVEKGSLIQEIGLVDISSESMKQLRTSIKSLKPQKKSKNYSSRSLSTNSYTPLEVHKIGNYNISVATSLQDLLNRIDWNKFNKPNDFEERVNTFKNQILYPNNFDYFYVVNHKFDVEIYNFGYSQNGQKDFNNKYYHQILDKLQNQQTQNNELR